MERITRCIPLLLLAACYQTHPPAERPADFAHLDLGEQVPQSVVVAAADEVQRCIGRPYDLDGWTAWVVVDSYECLSGDCFSCPQDTMQMCGPPPDGYSESEAPCECAGLTDFDTKRIAVAPDLAGLPHEVKHAGWKLMDPKHSEPEWSRCP